MEKRPNHIAVEPDKPGYWLPGAYRSISVLSMLGKLLDAVARKSS